MTSQGTAHGRFTRAIQRGHLLAAEMAAREMGHLSLSNALSLCILYRRAEDPKFERAAVRWVRRVQLETGPLLRVAGVVPMGPTGAVDCLIQSEPDGGRTFYRSERIERDAT